MQFGKKSVQRTGFQRKAFVEKSFREASYLRKNVFVLEKNCKSVEGFMVDFVDAVSKMFNFSWKVEKFPNDVWITSPKNWSDPNSTFSGMFGQFFSKPRTYS